MALLLAGLAAVAYGTGDLVGGLSIRRSGREGAALSTAVVATVVGCLVCSILLVVLPPEQVTSSDVGWSALAGLAMAATRPLLYLGMSRGPIAVFAPGYSLTAIAVPALAGPLIGQRLSGWEFLGVLLAIPAVLLLCGEGRLPRVAEVVRSAVLGQAVVVGFCIGLSGIFFSRVDVAAGIMPAFVTLLVGSLILPVYAVLAPGPRAPYRSVLRLGSLVGVTSAVAFALGTTAFQRGSAAVVTAMICMAPAVSILLAWRLLGERVARLQVLGGAFGIGVLILFALGA